MFKQSATILIAVVLVVLAAGLVISAEWVRYFPAGGLDARSPGSDNSRNYWYSSQLLAMGEPVLGPGKDDTTYRFTWLRSFHHPVAVRVTSAGGRIRFIATEMSGAGGYRPGSVLRRTSGSLTTDQFDEIEDLFRKSRFWTMPVRDTAMGHDGSEWIVEASAAGHYHVVDRWTPAAGPVNEIGRAFLSLTGWRFPPEEMY